MSDHHGQKSVANSVERHIYQRHGERQCGFAAAEAMKSSRPPFCGCPLFSRSAESPESLNGQRLAIGNPER
jgi:hypothetical protein